MAQMALLRPDDRTKALRDNVSELLSMDEPRKSFAAMMSGLDIDYDLGVGHPLLGRRMPDLDLITAKVHCGYSPCCTMPGQCCSTSVSSMTRHRSMVEPSAVDQCEIYWRLRSSGPRRGRRAHRCVDPA
jgi:hypothetical protein